jgi:peptidoglycan/LPS O-acetylase OafA/YrhL
MRRADGPDSFDPCLESVRGLAALMVAGWHALALLEVQGVGDLYGARLWEIEPPQAWLAKFLSLFLNGEAAVLMFFVLSGYVLALSLERSRSLGRKGWWIFYLKRLFRMYPALLVTTLLIVPYLWFGYEYRSRAHVSHWFPLFFRSPPDALEILRNLVLASWSVNPVTWTIRIEFLGSALMPIVHAVVRRRSRIADAALLALAVGGGWLAHRARLSLWLWTDAPYLFAFVLGTLLTRLEPSPTRADRQGLRRTGLVLGGLLFFGGSLLRAADPFVALLVTGLGATWLLACVVHAPASSRTRRLLQHRLPRFYGRVSYSFYLIHCPITFALLISVVLELPSVWLERWPLACEALLAALSIPIATLAAAALQRWVETPGQRAGRRLADRLRGTTGASPRGS